MKPRIYISALHRELDDIKGVPVSGLELVAALQSAGCSTHMPLRWRSYQEIEQEIDAHDAVVALVDKYWSSSTWKLSEVTYALDGVGACRVAPQHTSMPTFLFPLDATLDEGFPKTKNPPLPLPASVDEAVAQILKTMA